MILNKGNKKYILEKMYPNYALYSNMDYGIKECFSFQELGMVEEYEVDRQAKNGGACKI